MQRWEYKVVRLGEGRYTESLNEYGREGWELVSVAADARDIEPPGPARTRSIPVPRALGRLEDAASKLSNLGASESGEAPAAASTLMWVLRRALPDD
jgi:Domain of unknown function (DUF4177)